MAVNRIKRKELLRFLVGGGSAVTVDFLAYKGLMPIGLGRNIAKGSSFLLGSIIGFLINKYWTFESKKFSRREFLRYILLYSCTAVINAAVNKVVIMVVSVELLGFLCATGVSTILNFLGQKYFVFTTVFKETDRN